MNRNMTTAEKRIFATGKPSWWRRLNKMREADLRHREKRFAKRHPEKTPRSSE